MSQACHIAAEAQESVIEYSDSPFHAINEGLQKPIPNTGVRMARLNLPDG
jgi:hypothetical protein